MRIISRQRAIYLVITLGEVLVSTTGLEFAYSQAAPTMKSTIMGFWNLTVAMGNLLVTFVTSFAGKIVGGTAAQTGDVTITPAMFMFYAWLTFGIAIRCESALRRVATNDRLKVGEIDHGRAAPNMKPPSGRGQIAHEFS